MSTGTSAGLLEDLDENAQSLFKHELLGNYLPPFISMPGSKAKGKRVVLLDGFAGRGRYPDGRPASGERILQAMKTLMTIRNIEAFFVEKNESDHEILEGVVAEYVAQGVNGIAFPGDVEDHLDRIIARAHGVPLFLFLDPCGAGMTFDRLVEVLTGPRRDRWPPTEVLLNFSAHMSRRVSGAALAGYPAEQRVMDAACGGQWWRQTADEAMENAPRQRGGKRTYEPVVHAIARRYAQLIGKKTRMSWATVPVYRRLGQQPIYHLVFFTRSQHGLWVFGDAAARARKTWLRHQGELQDTRRQDAESVLFTNSDVLANRIEDERQEACAIIAGNIGRLLTRWPKFKLVDRTLQVFGTTYAVATDETVHKAVTDLQARGQLRIAPNHKPRTPIRDLVVCRPDTTS